MTHRLGVNGTDLGFMVTSIGPMVCGLHGGLATHTSADPWSRPAPRRPGPPWHPNPTPGVARIGTVMQPTLADP